MFLHVQKAAASILNKQLCKPTALALLVGGSAMLKIFSFYKINTLIYYRTLCSVLNLYGIWSRMACTLGNES